MKRAIGLLAMAVVLSLGGPARAQVTFFNFTSASDTGVYTKTYTAGCPVQTITATAIQGIAIDQTTHALTNAGTVSTTGNNTLYEKANTPTTGTGAETGLGLDSDGTGDHEITYSHGIKLDFSAIPMGPYSQVTFGSVNRVAVTT